MERREEKRERREAMMEGKKKVYQNKEKKAGKEGRIKEDTVFICLFCFFPLPAVCPDREDTVFKRWMKYIQY